MYKIEDVGFAYENKRVLHGVRFSVKKKSFVTIIGPNGSGKSTLFGILTGLFKPKMGQVIFAGKPLNEYGIPELAKKIAVVKQDTVVRFPFTCLEVVMMGRNPFQDRGRELKERDFEIVYEAMKKTDTLRFASDLITEISAGERQRVFLARAIAQTPEVIFLDEAFSAMDICYSVKSLDLLKELVEKEGISVVAIMHDLNMADTYSDMILALQDGQVLQWGQTENVMQPTFIKSLFKINVKKIGSRGLVVLPR